MVSNLGAAKSVAPCEATEPGKCVNINTYFNSKKYRFGISLEQYCVQ